MILRPLIAEEPRHDSPQSIWPVIERSQVPRLPECWLIPQPAHAALSGDIAARLDAKYFPGVTPEVVQAIALHDAGWGMPDAEGIQKSRASANKEMSPRSFIKINPQEVMNIWTFSVDTAQKLSAIGGYIVSRHFSVIGRQQSTQHDTKNRAFLLRFDEQETRRQEKLLAKSGRSFDELEVLVAALQFCDLLSLYISCGVLEDVVFPQQLEGREITLRRTGPGECSLHPFPLSAEGTFSVSGIRHPRLSKPHANGRTFSIRVTP